jgi:hypothetical protein
MPERFRQCLPFSWTTLRGKHCWHPIVIMGVVDTFWPGPINTCYQTVAVIKHFCLLEEVLICFHMSLKRLNQSLRLSCIFRIHGNP